MPFPKIWTHIRLSAEMARNRPDVLFIPAHVLPLIHPPRSVVTVHDVGYLYHASSYIPRERLYLKLSTRFSARFAEHLIADSAATRDDLVHKLGVDPAKISVVHLGVADAFRPDGHDSTLASLRHRLALAGDYIIHVGTLKPRKNLARLLAAFHLLRRESRMDLKLVLVGKPGGFSGTIRDGVIEAGYLSDADLAALIRGAVALAIPSLFEGFGLPALEAMACGTPVLASNTSSLPEVVGDAAILVDPLSVDSIHDGLAKLIDSSDLRQELAKKGIEQASKFSWQKTAEETLSVLEKVGRAAT
jgi:glycosyltransferase involved in cell wall biosynthesis